MAKKVTTKKETSQESAAINQQNENIARQLDVDIAVEKRLVALYTLQTVDSEIDKIKIIRGELPQAIQDLEDEIAGLETRIQNFNNDIAETNQRIANEKNEIAEHGEMIKKYQKQQDNVRNNREFEAINKEILNRLTDTKPTEHIFNRTDKHLCEQIDASNGMRVLQPHMMVFVNIDMIITIIVG